MIPFKNKEAQAITESEMQSLYEKLKTPKKHGAVIKWEKDHTDSPTVFRWKDSFYMYFIAISKNHAVSGYETHLAKSDDLLHWEYLGPVFLRNGLNHWDSKQCAAYAAFTDIRFDHLPTPEKIGERFAVSYLGGNSDGYEPDPLSMGMALTPDPTAPDSFTRFPEPILRPDDPDCRPLEDKTLYKSFLFRDPLLTTGHPYVNCYNARANNYTERIYLAVSDDGIRWERYGDRAVLDLVSNEAGEVVCGDPQILLIDDIYVMLFFRWGEHHAAYNTFAASRNLSDWTPWRGKPLIEPEYDWENIQAHKPWFVRYNGKNYHFYCAVNSQNERFIAVATD